MIIRTLSGVSSGRSASPGTLSTGVTITHFPSQVPVLPPPSIPRQSTDFGLRLPEGWTQNVCEGDRGWIGRSVFSAKGKLSPNLKVWWHPPSYQLPSVKPSPEVYFHRRLLLWMPRRMWKVDFHCPRCIPTQLLRSKGVYNHVRLVLDTQNYYYLGGEYMDCRGCHGTFVSWDARYVLYVYIYGLSLSLQLSIHCAGCLPS